MYFQICFPPYLLSEQVGNALSMSPHKEEMSETARFVKMFDKYVIFVL